MKDSIQNISPLGSQNTGTQTYFLQAGYWKETSVAKEKVPKDSDIGFTAFLKIRPC